IIYPPKAKLFCGFIYSDEEILDKTISLLSESYGKIILKSESFPFQHTCYYETMGQNLKKVLIAFDLLIERDQMALIKIHSNEIENLFLDNGKRKINIDPGYLTLSNVYLASCKEYYHRIYIGNGIYLENEYYWSKKDYVFFEWTYPDYKTEGYLKFFKELRKIYAQELKK
ncbi:MAG TPA: DUF4416 family protein, partial [Spirochaetota bacterium]|nr:DUF4416 family protein [Spirochaetota bacterium]